MIPTDSSSHRELLQLVRLRMGMNLGCCLKANLSQGAMPALKLMEKLEEMFFHIRISSTKKFCDTKYIGMNRSLTLFKTLFKFGDITKLKVVSCDKESRAKISARLTGLKFIVVYYYMKNYCDLIGLEQWYFSLI